MSDAENLCLDASADKAAAVPRLISRIEAHELEGGIIAFQMETLRLDAKKLKAIRAAKKTLDALMGIDPALANQVQA
jgi:hypothetical protein